MKHKLKALFNALPFRKREPPDHDITLYLHIGMPKTGTTAIQSFLYHNRIKLRAKYGICYPDSALHWYQQVSVVKAAISPVFSHAHFNEAIPSIDAGLWLQNVKEASLTQKCNKVIVSSEFFWASPAMQLPLESHRDTVENFNDLEEGIKRFHALFSGFSKIRIIVYLREQSKWLESFFNQQIKDGFSIPDEAELLPVKIYLLYYRNLQLWSRYFGKDNIIVKSFEQAGTDIVADFCRVIGVDSTLPIFSDRQETDSINSSLSPQAVRVMRLAIEQNISRERLEKIRDQLLSGSLSDLISDDNSGTGVFSERFLKRIQSVYREDTLNLAETYPVMSSYLNEVIMDTDALHHESGDQVYRDSHDQQILTMLLKRISPNDSF